LVRERIQNIFVSTNSTYKDDLALLEEIIKPISQFKSTIPAKINGYTDFVSCKNHMINMYTILGKNPADIVNENWARMPLGYHGKSSSIVVSGTPLIRPKGQSFNRELNQPVYGPTQKLDHEVELGVFLGGNPNKNGEPISISSAEENIFGYVILNDWSAREICLWEMNPFGLFTGKNFQTTISPWIITSFALEPFKAPFDPQDPVPVEYLQESNHAGYNINFETFIKTESLSEPFKISMSNMCDLYWSPSQQLAHLTVSGANIEVGEIYGSGAVASKDNVNGCACFMEINKGGRVPLALPNGESRVWIEDGDEIIITANCKGNGFVVGFGEARGKVFPSI